MHDRPLPPADRGMSPSTAAKTLAQSPRQKAELLELGISVRTGEPLTRVERDTLVRAEAKRTRRARARTARGRAQAKDILAVPVTHA